MVNQESAVEVINIIWRLRESPAQLGAWWFSVYYTFNSCLVLYGILLVLFHQLNHVEASAVHPSARYSNLVTVIMTLHKGIEAIEKVGNGTETAEKMCRTLVKVVQISATLGEALQQETRLH